MKVGTAKEMEEERLRTLYIRLPHTIKNMDVIRDLVFGDVDIKLPRQSGRHCHVIFSSVEDKLKNMKALKTKRIDNKPIFVKNPKVQDPEVKKQKQKKMKKIKPVVVSKPKAPEKVTKICFLHKVPKSATVKGLKALFPEAKNISILYKQRLHDDITGRTAIIKFRDLKTAAAYLNKERPMPLCKGVQLEIKCDKRRQKNKKKKTETLKIYDGDGVETEVKEKEEAKSRPEDEDEVKSESEDEDEVGSEQENNEEEEPAGDDEDPDQSSGSSEEE
ncbi:uncharacterized protein LOC135163179 [Diachasmimorpha longicaudata]|uniref:uncharacterized protein LOC135163179 n=1 Tax=Diachasmimorpha longicaudata TaxID=58733 RepID=UPI0030B8D451